MMKKIAKLIVALAIGFGLLYTGLTMVLGAVGAWYTWGVDMEALRIGMALILVFGIFAGTLITRRNKKTENNPIAAETTSG